MCQAVSVPPHPTLHTLCNVPCCPIPGLWWQWLEARVLSMNQFPFPPVNTVLILYLSLRGCVQFITPTVKSYWKEACEPGMLYLLLSFVERDGWGLNAYQLKSGSKICSCLPGFPRTAEVTSTQTWDSEKFTLKTQTHCHKYLQLTSNLDFNAWEVGTVAVQCITKQCLEPWGARERQQGCKLYFQMWHSSATRDRNMPVN